MRPRSQRKSPALRPGSSYAKQDSYGALPSPIHWAARSRLFVGRDFHGSRQLGGIDPLGMMKAAADCDRCGDNGKGDKDAHDLIPLLALSLGSDTQNCRPSDCFRLRKALMRAPFLDARAEKGPLEAWISSEQRSRRGDNAAPRLDSRIRLRAPRGRRRNRVHFTPRRM